MAGLIFGIDLGIASCGWAVIRAPHAIDETGDIIAMGSWLFDVPETDKERTPTNQIRRSNRLLRRVVRRRAQRMAAVRKLLHQHGVLESHSRNALALPELDPWPLRAEALSRKANSKEWAVILGHIAKRRGFKSSAKRKETNASNEDSAMLKAINANKEKLSKYSTVGEMFARDPEFIHRKRNRDNIYDRTQMREELLSEVKTLFHEQRRLGNPHASVELEEDYIQIVFFQRPLQDSEKMVAFCPFEQQEKRAPKCAPTYELFRLITRLHNVRISDGIAERPLTQNEINKLADDAGHQASMSVTYVRRILGLKDSENIVGYKKEEENRDIASRTATALPATYKLRKALGEDLWAQIIKTPETLDEIAHILSFFETNERILKQINNLPINTEAKFRLEKGLNDGNFSTFKGAAHLSSKAMRAIIPHLLSGLRYDLACAAAGYDHSASRWSHIEQVTDKKSFNKVCQMVTEEMANPIARKSLTEALKQIWAMCNRWGLPDAIHIELARDVGNSAQQRYEIEKNLEETTADRVRQRKEIAELLNIEDVNGDMLLRYRLWKEQNGRCPYTDKEIPITALLATDNRFQVDHILPWSRFGDDSFNNKVLCAAQANQDKKARTPYEWMLTSKAPEAWDHFVARIEGNKQYKGIKKRNFLLKDAKAAEERFRTRNLNDTRYATRLLAEAVKLFYPKAERGERGGIRRVYTRPGALTATLRQAWGLESLKKVNGKRVDDSRHHAIDALVVAAVSEWEVQKLTREYQKWKDEGVVRGLRQVNPPWGTPASFRAQVQDIYETILVARPERRRARGEGHAATIRQVREREGKTIVYERKSIKDLTEKDLDRIKDADRNQALINSLRMWIANKKPMNELPLSPTGHEIKKVRLATTGKPAVAVRGGSADRSSIVRVDVFTKPKEKGKDKGKDEFYLVPIYAHQVMNKKEWPAPPNKAIAQGKSEDETWPVINEMFLFKFSLYSGTLAEIAKPDGQILFGYFNGVNRATASLTLHNCHRKGSKFDDNGNSMDGIGAKTLHYIKKFNVNRLGEKHEIKSEKRTWHGVVCTFLSPQS